MAEKADQTPQGEVGASGGDSQQTSGDDKRTSLIGTDTGADAPEDEVKTDAVDDDKVKTDDGKDDDGANLEGEEGDEKTDDGAPDEYQPFKMPEGLELDTAAMEKAAPVFKELGLSQEKSQKLVDIYAGLKQEEDAKQQANLNAMRDGWAKEITSDPAHKETLAGAKKAVEAFGDDELRTFLYDNWVGDYPPLVRFLGKIGAAIGNDKMIDGDGFTDGRTRLDRIYNKME